MSRPRANPLPEPGYVSGQLTLIRIEENRDSCNRVRRQFIVRCSCGSSEWPVTEYNFLKKRVVRCRSCLESRKRRTLEERGLGRVWDSYREGARTRGLEFALDKTQVSGIIGRECTYCARPPSNKRLVQTMDGPEYFTYNGIDRIDSNRGYHIDNCVPCCGVCNKMKSSMTTDEFLTHIMLIAKHYGVNN